MSDARERIPHLAPGDGQPTSRRASEEAALAEDVDLDFETRRRIVDAHAALEQTDHYKLLGVERTADTKALKNAYHRLAAAFHPDRYFRKRLGTFKFRMEVVFGHLTVAYETLSNAERRQEYDAYLEEQQRALGIEKLLADSIAEARRAEESIEREVRAQTPLAAAPPTSTVPPPARVTTPVVPGPTVDMAARRDALARRLLGGRGPSGSSAPPPTSASLMPPAMPTVADAMESLRRRYEERVVRAKSAQARKYVASGEMAMRGGDPVSAANAFRIAVSLTPTDPEIVQLARDAQAKADEVLSEAYSRQAAYEEKNDQWTQAARSWSRVCKARPNDVNAHEHGAIAIAKSGGDLHEAARLASQACALEPGNARFRVALANVYQAAGLALNARRELETAAQLAPHDGTIQAMMKRVGK